MLAECEARRDVTLPAAEAHSRHEMEAMLHRWRASEAEQQREDARKAQAEAEWRALVLAGAAGVHNYSPDPSPRPSSRTQF